MQRMEWSNGRLRPVSGKAFLGRILLAHLEGQTSEQFAEQEMRPQIGDIIMAEWPGHDGLREFAIGCIREDEDGVECAVFGEGSTIGAEAIEDLVLSDDGKWYVKSATA